MSNFFNQPEWVLSFVGAVLLGLVHLLGYRLRFLDGTPRSKWLSFAGGVSIAYIFLYLLPELEAHQDQIIRQRSSDNNFIKHPLYLVTLLSLSVYYGVEHFIKKTGVSDKAKHPAEAEQAKRTGVFYFHLAFFAIYNLIIGNILEREPWRLLNLSLFVLAMSLHFLVNDFGLIQHYRKEYKAVGRWVLGLTPLAGWLLGTILEIKEAYLGYLVSFIVGGTILNVLKEELPEERKSNFWSFFIGVIIYGLLLMALE